MNFGLIVTLSIAKIAIHVCRVLHWGGTTLPGRIAKFLYPDIAATISRRFRTIMVTGTNGKTTTTRIIGQMLIENGIGFITNRSGANMPGGIITTFVNAVNIFGECKESTALIEVDEVAFNRIAAKIKPRVLVVTNFFRDQLDRYGELYSTLGNVREGIAQIPDCRLVLNADDSLCASLGLEPKNPVIYYGFKGTYRGVREATNTDAMFCIVCKAKYEYLNHIYGHLGEFRCPECGYARPESDITCTSVIKLDPAFSEIELRVGTDDFKARVNLPGVYNIYNALAAIAVGKTIGMPTDASIRAVGNFEGGFGRMETIETNGRSLNVILVKNPTGFNQVLNYLLTEDRTMCAAFVINDNYADGTDISWIWDVDFEKLVAIDFLTDRIYTSGLRAEDMAVRLKYAGVPEAKIKVMKDYAALIDDGLAKTPEGGRFYILPSYTAMLDVRKVLVKKFGLKEFWR